MLIWRTWKLKSTERQGVVQGHPTSDWQSGTIPGLLLQVRVPESYALEYLLECCVHPPPPKALIKSWKKELLWWLSGYKTTFNAGDEVSIPGQGSKLPHALRPKPKTQNRNNAVANSIKTLKMVHIKTNF